MEGSRRTFHLDQLYEFASGLSKPKSEFGEGFPFLSFRDVFYNTFVPRNLSELVKSSETERQNLSIKRGDVFLTRTSETVDELGMSCVALTDVPNATFNGFTKRLRPKSQDEVVPEYAGYFFRSPGFRSDVYAMSSLSTRASLNNEMLARLSIALPPVGVQAAIGQVLKALDDKIDVNRRMNETLEAMARALFNAWFVDVDPVHAIATDLAKEGVLEIGDGYRAKNSELGAPGLPFLRGGDLNDGFNTTGAEILSQASVAKAGAKISRNGDVAFTSKGTIGRFARVNEHTERFVYSPQVCYWRSLDAKRLNPTILYCWMTGGDLLTQILAISGQTDMAPYASLRDQRAMEVPVFPESQQDLAAKIEPLLERQATSAAEIKTLTALRDALLPKLISGELRIKAAEKIVEAVA